MRDARLVRVVSVVAAAVVAAAKSKMIDQFLFREI
jgi:hypothetical protein